MSRKSKTAASSDDRKTIDNGGSALKGPVLTTSSAKPKSAIPKPMPEARPSSVGSATSGASVPLTTATAPATLSNSLPVHDAAEEKNPRPRRGGATVALYYRLSALRGALARLGPKWSSNSDAIVGSVSYTALWFSALLAARMPRLGGHFASLYSIISEYRMFYRMYYTPATVKWALDLLLDNSNTDCVLRVSDYVQAVAGVGYQVFEDFAYLAMKGVLPISAARQMDLWVVACALWSVHVLLELLKQAYFRATGKPVSLRTLFVNLAWAPLTVHWSTYTGLFGPGWVGLLGAAASWPPLVARW